MKIASFLLNAGLIITLESCSYAISGGYKIARERDSNFADALNKNIGKYLCIRGKPGILPYVEFRIPQSGDIISPYSGRVITTIDSGDFLKRGFKNKTVTICGYVERNLENNENAPINLRNYTLKNSSIR